MLRPFPLDEPFTRALHPNATEYAVGAECVGYYEDIDGYYDFIDEIFRNDFVNSTAGSDLENLLAVFAERAGVDSDDFKECYAEQDLVYIQEVFSGVVGEVQGTPTVYIEHNGGVYQTVSNYDLIRSQLEQLI